MDELIRNFLDNKSCNSSILHINFRTNEVYFGKQRTQIMHKIYNVIIYYPSRIHCMQTSIKVNLYSWNYKQHSNLFEKDLESNIKLRDKFYIFLEKGLLECE